MIASLPHLSLPMLLAETHMAEVSLQYREDAAAAGISSLWYLAIPVGLVAIAAIIYKIVDRPPAIVNTPQGMLHELCKVHSLNSASRRLLERIAEEADLKHPAVIFLGIQQFESAVDVARRQMRFSRRDNSTLGMLRRRLFAEA